MESKGATTFAQMLIVVMALSAAGGAQAIRVGRSSLGVGPMTVRLGGLSLDFTPLTQYFSPIGLLKNVFVGGGTSKESVVVAAAPAVLVTSTAASPTAPPSSPSPSPPLVTVVGPIAPGPAPGCPDANPSSCAFFFEGYENRVPVFDISKTSSDTTFTTAIFGSVMGTAVPTLTVNSGPAEVVCGTDSHVVGQQYYTNGNSVSLRTVQPVPGMTTLVGSYVKIPLTSVAIDIFGTLVNLTPGDGQTKYFPEDQRCVVFKVTG